VLSEGERSVPVTVGPAALSSGALRSVAVDRAAQEDARRFVWSGENPASASWRSAGPLDLRRETNGDVALELDLRIDALATGRVTLSALCGNACGGTLDVTQTFQALTGKGWQTLSIPLACFAKAGLDVGKVDVPASLTTTGGLSLTVSRLALGSSGAGLMVCAK